MSGFLSRLIEKHNHPGKTVSPRLRGRFEPAAPFSGSFSQPSLSKTEGVSSFLQDATHSDNALPAFNPPPPIFYPGTTDRDNTLPGPTGNPRTDAAAGGIQGSKVVTDIPGDHAPPGIHDTARNYGRKAKKDLSRGMAEPSGKPGSLADPGTTGSPPGKSTMIPLTVKTESASLPAVGRGQDLPNGSVSSGSKGKARAVDKFKAVPAKGIPGEGTEELFTIRPPSGRSTAGTNRMKESRGRPAQPDTVIKVSIGRIEVRAVMEPSPSGQKPRPQPKPYMSLNEYLNKRNPDKV